MLHLDDRGEKKKKKQRRIRAVAAGQRCCPCPYTALRRSKCRCSRAWRAAGLQHLPPHTYDCVHTVQPLRVVEIRLYGYRWLFRKAGQIHSDVLQILKTEGTSLQDGIIALNSQVHQLFQLSGFLCFKEGAPNDFLKMKLKCVPAATIVPDTRKP